MKRTLLLLILLTVSFSFANTPPAKRTSNPAIGITMTGFFIGPNTIQFDVRIKNIGDEPLLNINFQDASPAGQGSFQLPASINSLAPGEELTGIPAMKYGVSDCFDLSMLAVQAVNSVGTNVGDLSSDYTQFDQNGLPGSYYNDFFSETHNFVQNVNASQNGIYEDLNGDGIVDVGDVVNYTYNITAFGLNPSANLCQIVDNNAEVLAPNFDLSPGFYSTTGKHYLTQVDVNLGYVYNTSYVIVPNSCQGVATFQDETYCGSCPNPGANIVTKLTGLLPNSISGMVNFNTSGNCDTGFSFPNRRITATEGTHEYTTFTGFLGNYSLLIPNAGSYNTSALASLGNNFSSTPASVTVASSGEGNDYANTDFCINSSTNYSDLRVNMFNINQAIPGFSVSYRVFYENTGSTTLNGSVNIAIPANVLLNFTSSPFPDAFANNTATFNYANLLPFERRSIELNFLVSPPPTVNTGDVLTFTVDGTPLTGDSHPADNTFVLHQTVFSSFDPNDKTVLEGETITAAQATGYLNYVTRFQNTGTANATTVVVKETLDADLDWSTFEPIDASHYNNVQIRNGNELTYTFPNIGLPYESANEPGSHGWLAYRIKPKSGFTIGDIASSGSSIYFDFNPPVLTNSVNTQIEPLATTGFTRDNFVVYPNPAHDFINIENKENLIGVYEIADSNGKILQTGKIENSGRVAIAALQNGFYFMSIKTTAGKATYKLIKN